MLAPEIWKVELELDILSKICVDVYCSREDPPLQFPHPQTLQRKRDRILYIIISTYVALPKPC